MLRQRIQDDMKAALKAGDKCRLGAIRLVLAAIRQREVDEQIELDDLQVLAVLDKLVKQRCDAIEQYTKANREDLAEQEGYEVGVCREYLPAPLAEDELPALIAAAITAVEATSMRDMGKVMARIKSQVQGRADLSAVSGLVRERLAG